MEALWILLFGLLYRGRGGLWDDLLHRDIPSTVSRGLWSLAVTVTIMAYAIELWRSPLIFTASGIAIFAAAFWGVCYGYFGGQFDLSKTENRNWNNYARLSARGMWIILPVATALSIANILIPINIIPVWVAVAAGSGFVLYYLLGNVIRRYWKVQRHTQYGEWLLGLTIGSALCLTKSLL